MGREIDSNAALGAAIRYAMDNLADGDEIEINVSKGWISVNTFTITRGECTGAEGEEADIIYDILELVRFSKAGSVNE